MPKRAQPGSLDFLEKDLLQLYRLRGQHVPISVEEVAAAEERLAPAALSLPSALNDPPALTTSTPISRSTGGSRRIWTNRSVKALRSDDPVEFITQKARDVVLSAIEGGWNGPPYDPSQLAELRNISLLPTQEVTDARTRSVGGKFRIEFNPQRPTARLRFSIAHEIAHTLFPDCSEAIRNRATHEQVQGDEWQLEMLCNVAAAEILMPTGSLPDPGDFVPTVDSLVQLRRRFQVSAEAVLLRLLRLTGRYCFAFAAHKEPGSEYYTTDYVIRSRAFSEQLPIAPGFILPKNTRAAECTAIGFTAKGNERWSRLGGDWEAEYLGISAYRGHTFPRVLAIVRPADAEISAPNIRFLKGDASKPRGSGKKLLLQVVNDKAVTWGAGFAKTLKSLWPSAQRDFTHWAMSRRSEFRLGAVHFTDIRDDLRLASLVAQHGYGPSDTPRIRYAALERSLRIVAADAKECSATIHTPRIGAGLAGGTWTIIEEILQQTLGREGFDITVYDLPNQKPPPKRQLSLFDVPKDEDQFV